MAVKKVKGIWVRYTETTPSGAKRSFWQPAGSKSEAKRREKLKTRKLKVSKIRKTKPKNIAGSPWHPGEHYERKPRGKFKKGYRTTQEIYEELTGKKPRFPVAGGDIKAGMRLVPSPPKRRKKVRWQPGY